MNLLPIPRILLILLYSALWIAFHFASGYLAHRLPDRVFVSGRFPYRLFPWERSGRFYERVFRIRSWKRRVPEAGALFRGGFSKKRLSSADPEYLRQFLTATCRAEFSHWLTFLLGLTFFLWNPPLVGWVMMGYAAAANFPCIIIQRYNRARLERILASP